MLDVLMPSSGAQRGGAVIVVGTRLQILQLLQRQHRATVEQLAQGVELASATVRRHLDILQRDRLITYTPVKKRTGRPEYAYHLTERGQETLPKNYAHLLGSLFTELKSLGTEEIQGQNGTQVLEFALQRMSNRLVQQRAHEVNDEDQGSRLRVLVDLLQEGGFAPEVEQQPQGNLRIRLLNCPFRAVALGDETVCTFDHHLISTFLGARVTKEQCISDGSPACCYVASLSRQSAGSPSL